MSRRQYGFMPGKSTEDALYDILTKARSHIENKEIVLMVSLDIEGAFDNAWWPAIKYQLSKKDCPKQLRLVVEDYFKGRKVVVRYANREHVRRPEKGCIQGSISGPTFWNILLDPLLVELEEDGTYAQAFADDVVLLFSGTDTHSIAQRANVALEYVRKWGIENKLNFAPQKTKAMVLTRRLKFDTPIIRMNGQDIAIEKEIKLLGLTIDGGLTFNKHVHNVTRKAAEIYKKVSRMAKLEWGMTGDMVLQVYQAVIEPTVTYASAAWAPTVKKMCTKKKLETVQRAFGQKIAKTYRTASLNSATLLAGILPLDLRVEEAAAMFEARRGSSPFIREGDRIERAVPAIEQPHPAERPDISFAITTDPGQIQNENITAIYTDGSKTEKGVGAAWTKWEGGRERKWKKIKMAPYCTVYQAELAALVGAVREATAAGADVNICSDSRSSLEAIAGGRSRNPRVVEIRSHLVESRKKGQNIRLHWVKAHVGTEGNERADELARAAAETSKVKAVHVEYPLSYIRKEVRRKTIEEWDKRYREGTTGGITKIFLKNVASAHKQLKEARFSPEMAQILTGHGPFAEYLCRFKLKETPECECDSGVEQTIPHLLIECPIFASSRCDLEQMTGMVVSLEGLPDMLACYRSHLEEFCIKIIKRTAKFNGSKGGAGTARRPAPTC
ncbi:uncharacterized protein LOC123689264 [Pieris rapae]|uniref:uncharacterized protein LOC123689264 n=1 Tax=Pieris rapae TaxID=64459 RepID=UPI001E27A9E0|nr:uncharacterized protein LOC123689264 [Pieris rapae]